MLGFLRHHSQHVAPTSRPLPELIEMRASDPLLPRLTHNNLDDDISVSVDGETDIRKQRRLLWKLGLSFFLFGLINNVLYVIILSAALDLVPPSTPKGVILFCNITPSLVAKVAWPYLLRGRIRYAKRLIGCCLLSSLGMIIVATFDVLPMRLLGISFASFSSGLGELTFLQLSTTYKPSYLAGHSVGYFSSGTGAAGLFGALLWWEVRSLGVRLGVGLSSVMPLLIPLTYYLFLPHKNTIVPKLATDYVEDTDLDSTYSYAPIPVAECISGEDQAIFPSQKGAFLSANDKWHLVQPLLLKYMLPLFCVYLFEYTINQGVAPTLLYPVPSHSDHPLLSKVIHSIRDYYPLWQLVYQTTVFLSRSTISLGLPPLPAKLLPFPAILQAFILFILALESGIGLFPGEKGGMNIVIVFCLISLEGLCGGLAYVNVFFHINQDDIDLDDSEQSRQEKEFKIGSVGFADSSGILLASLLAMPTELELCKAQVRRGNLLCRSL